MREKSLPKINLFLDVLSRRDDGYHEIETVFLPLRHPVDIVDITPCAESTHRIICNSAEVPSGPDNLCWRAADAFAEKTQISGCWRIAIRKEIPVAGGLGGGSSNAAAVLRALNRLNHCPLSADELRRIGASLGADVPFFIEAAPALGTGIGDRLRPISCKADIGVVLVCPGFPVSASWAYGQLGRTSLPPAPLVGGVIAGLESNDLDRLCGHCCNALEVALLDKFPLLGLLCGELLDAGCLCAHVSGSGPSVFGLCRAEDAAGISDTIREAAGTAARVFDTGPAVPTPTG